MARILENVRVKAKLLIKPLCHKYFPQTGICLFKVNNRNNRISCEICYQ